MSDPPADLTLPLASRRRQRAQRIQKLQHAIPTVALLAAGVQGVFHGEHGFALALSVFEIGVSALLLRSLVKELKEARRPHHGERSHHGVEWFDVFAAGVLTAEALEHWHVHHHLPRPTILLAAVTLALGLFHGRIAAFAARKRVLRIDAGGLLISGRFFRRFFARWPEIERIDVDDRQARIVARGGRERRLDLTDLPNASAVRAALLAARERLPPAP